MNDFAEETARVADRVRRLSETCDFGFWFVTDLHVPSNLASSPALLARLVQDTGVRTVVCGGDVPEAFGSREDLLASIERDRSVWVRAVEEAGGDFFPIRGNHDFTTRAAPGADCGYTLPEAETRAIVLDTGAVRAHACVDPSSCAWFSDFPEARVRLVAADTSSAPHADRSWWAVSDGISGAQSDWLCGTALATLPAGWSAILASHVPLAGVAAPPDAASLFGPLLSVLSTPGASEKIPLALSGHVHGEQQSRCAGVWHVTEPCDAAYKDYIGRSAPWDPDLPLKEPGTWAGQTFDAVQFDRKRGRIHFTRVGGGTDRAILLRPLRMRPGETASLRPETLAGPAKWAGYDCDGCETVPIPGQPYGRACVYHLKTAEISPDGAVRALRPGEAVAVARAADGSREYLPLEVLP